MSKISIEKIYPRFGEWIARHQSRVDAFDPERFYLPGWAERVTHKAIEETFGRAFPDEFFRLARAYSFIVAMNSGQRGLSTVLLDLGCAEALASGERHQVNRYHNQPAELYPFGEMGVDGVSYNFCFDDQGYAVVYFSPTDDKNVPWCYPTVRDFVASRILRDLPMFESIQNGEGVEEFVESFGIETESPRGELSHEEIMRELDPKYLEISILAKGLGIDLTFRPPKNWRDRLTDSIRALVRQGRFPTLRPFL